MSVGFIGSEADMILVKIDVVSGGDYDRQKQIGAIEIANVTGFGTGRISSDYKYRLFSEDGEKQFEGKILDSYNTNVFQLISECLNAWRDGWIETPDQHGLGGTRI